MAVKRLWHTIMGEHDIPALSVLTGFPMEEPIQELRCSCGKITVVAYRGTVDVEVYDGATETWFMKKQPCVSWYFR